MATNDQDFTENAGTQEENHHTFFGLIINTDAIGTELPGFEVTLDSGVVVPELRLKQDDHYCSAFSIIRIE